MRPRLILGPMLAALLAAGCGLPSSYYLTPPAMPGSVAGTGSAVPGTPVFYIISTTANSESEFRGFELYYKCYRITETIESGLGEGSLESDLRAKGFLPVCSELDSTPAGRGVPLIPIKPADRGHSFIVAVNFNSPIDAAFDYTSPATGVRRFVSFDPTSCKTFDSTQFMATDVDISRILADAQGDGYFYLAMYALSYGLQDISTPIWSYPVYLGYVEIRF